MFRNSNGFTPLGSSLLILVAALLVLVFIAIAQPNRQYEFTVPSEVVVTCGTNMHLSRTDVHDDGTTTYVCEEN